MNKEDIKALIEDINVTLLPSGELLVDTKYANEAKSVRLMDREGFTRAFEEPKTGRWIPVSERMPEETGWYFVTFKIHGGGYATCELSYRKPENYWTSTDISRKVFSNDEVIAWMPLPKPYEDGKE